MVAADTVIDRIVRKILKLIGSNNEDGRQNDGLRGNFGGYHVADGLFFVDGIGMFPVPFRRILTPSRYSNSPCTKGSIT